MAMFWILAYVTLLSAILAVVTASAWSMPVATFNAPIVVVATPATMTAVTSPVMLDNAAVNVLSWAIVIFTLAPSVSTMTQ